MSEIQGIYKLSEIICKILYVSSVYIFPETEVMAFMTFSKQSSNQVGEVNTYII